MGSEWMASNSIRTASLLEDHHIYLDEWLPLQKPFDHYLSICPAVIATHNDDQLLLPVVDRILGHSIKVRKSTLFGLMADTVNSVNSRDIVPASRARKAETDLE